MDVVPVYSENDSKYKCFPCFCINYKIGAVIVAGIEIFLSLVECILIIVLINIVGENEMNSYDPTDVKQTEFALEAVDIALMFISVAVEICLLIGVIRQNSTLLVPYMIKTMVLMILSILGALMSRRGRFGLISLVWNTYFLYVVYRCRSMFLDKKAYWRRCDLEAKMALAVQDMRLVQQEMEEEERDNQVDAQRQEV